MNSSEIALSDLARQDNDEARDRCQKKLDKLMTSYASAKFACMSTADGRLYAFAGTSADAAPQRIAALTSAHVALSESFSKEVLEGGCGYVTITAQAGCLVAVRLRSTRGGFIFSLGNDTSENLAMALRIALDTAACLAEMIN